MAIVYAIVDNYQPVVAGLQDDIDEIEDDVFGASPTVSRRVYELTREVIEFQLATGALEGILARLMDEPEIDDEQRRHPPPVQTTATSSGLRRGDRQLAAAFPHRHPRMVRCDPWLAREPVVAAAHSRSW